MNVLWARERICIRVVYIHDHGSHVYTHNNAKFAPPVGELPTVTDAKSEVKLAYQSGQQLFNDRPAQRAGVQPRAARIGTR